VARHFAVLEEEAGVNSVAVIDKARAITTGAANEVEKEEAIFEFVKNEVELAKGPEYDRFSTRPAAEVLETMSASGAEKVLLMESLLQTVKSDGRISGVHRMEYGPLSTEVPGYQNFTDFALRCGDDDPRWYVPYVAHALSNVDELIEKVDAAAAKQKWYKLEKVGGNQSPITGSADAWRRIQQVVEELAVRGQLLCLLAGVVDGPKQTGER